MGFLGLWNGNVSDGGYVLSQLVHKAEASSQSATEASKIQTLALHRHQVGP